MRRRRTDGRVHLGGLTVEERIRASVQRDLAELAAAEPGVDEADTPEDLAPAEPTEPRELILGVDIFLMPDGIYVTADDVAEAARQPRPPTPQQQAEHHYHVLLAELEARRELAPCHDDDRFIADHIPLTDIPELQRLCEECPVRGLCRSYANYIHPEVGYWGGRDFTPRTGAERRMQLSELMRNRSALQSNARDQERVIL